MFGYILPFKPELKLREFDSYKSVYCGLCKQISKDYGQLARLTLNYDFSFLALLAMALNPKAPAQNPETCIINPIKKRPCAEKNDSLRFCASVAMLMVYYKLKDNFNDDKLFKKILSLFAIPFAWFYRRKALKLAPEADEIIRKPMQNQIQVEKDPNAGIDKSAHSSSEAMALICQKITDKGEREKTVLYRFGYLLGRYVYLADALDDFVQDKKHGRFNPFFSRFTDVSAEMKNYAEQAICLTISQLASAYELLEIHHYKPILDNIIYLGLKNTIRNIMNKFEK